MLHSKRLAKQESPTRGRNDQFSKLSACDSVVASSIPGRRG